MVERIRRGKYYTRHSVDMGGVKVKYIDNGKVGRRGK